MDIKLYKSPWRAIKMMLLCSIFVFVGIFLLTKTDAPAWVGWLNICFFGMSYPIGVFNLLDRRPHIMINEIGIFDRTAYRDYINWEVIQNAYPIDLNGQKFVCLVVDEKYEPSIKKGKFLKSISNIGKAFGAQELNIHLGQIKIDEVKLTAFILSMIILSPEERKKQLNEKLLS